MKVHKRFIANLKLFLEAEGFTTYVNSIDEDFCELVVQDSDRHSFLKAVLEEVKKTTFVPYHYTLSTIGGNFDTRERMKFSGTLVDEREFSSVNGEFRLLLLRSDEGNYYLWKTFTDKIIEANKKYLFSCRFKYKLTSIQGSPITLVNYVRIKECV